VRRAHVVSLIVVLAVAVGSLLATILSGRSPQLGLDLQGGASVVLAPKNRVDSGVLDQSIDIIRSRVDALGVAEPDISRQGDTIVVQLPGVKNKDRALQLVGTTAQLFFRPVLEVLPADEETPTPATTAPTTTAPTPTTAPGTPTTAAPATTTTVAGATTTTAAPAGVQTTSREENKPDQEVVLPERDRDGKVVARYRLGPAELTGRAISSAQANVEPTTGRWLVDFRLNGKGSKEFDELAARNVGKQVAIDLDGVVKSAPTIQETSFNGRGQITGEFSEREAKDLALVLRYGSLPVELERQSVQTVSATLGRDSLTAGIAAGVIGLALVALYMVLYYRLLGIVVWVGLAVSGALMYSIVTWLGQTSGLALTLAGATGIIVSVGVTVDSYVVYFERLKDEVRSGKTVRSSVDRGFSRAYRTILAADAASFIGAALLYLLTVGPVRGFAFFLGLSTLLDVFIAYFFTRPMVILLGRNRMFTEARWLGVARGLAARPAAEVA
jgi:preprotein translocase subunit SecD